MKANCTYLFTFSAIIGQHGFQSFDKTKTNINCPKAKDGNILGFKSINNQSINQVLLRMAQPLLKYLTKYVNIFPRNVTFATWFVVDF